MESRLANSFSENPHEKTYLLWLGVILLHSFMVIGNALYLYTSLNRRILQASVLFLGLISLITWLVPILLRTRQKNTFFPAIQQLRYLTCLIFFILIPPAINFLRSGQTAKTKAFIYLSVNVAFFCLLFAGLCALLPSKMRKSESIKKGSPRYYQGFIFFICGWGLALTAWFFGPPENEVLINLGGSNTFLAVQAAIGLFSTFFIFSPLSAIILATPFAYLLFFATARLGVLLFILLLLMLMARQALRCWRKQQSFFKSFLVAILPALLTCSMVYPVASGGKVYPYYSPAKPSKVIQYRKLELARRYARLARILPFDVSAPFDNFISFFHLIPEAANPGNCREGLCTKNELIQSLNKTPEARLDILKLTIRAAAASPFGYWPKPFEEVVDIDCDVNFKCPYSHNIILDTFLILGWSGGILFSLFILALATLFCRLMILSSDGLEIFLCLCLFSHFAAMQFTGNHFDYAPILLLLGVLVIYVNTKDSSGNLGKSLSHSIAPSLVQKNQ